MVLPIIIGMALMILVLVIFVPAFTCVFKIAYKSEIDFFKPSIFIPICVILFFIASILFGLVIKQLGLFGL